MSKALSMILRLRVIEAIVSGLSCRAARRQFGI